MIGSFDSDSSGECSTVECVHGVGVDEVIHVARTADVKKHGDTIWGEFLFFKRELDRLANSPVATTRTPGGGVAGELEGTWLAIYHVVPMRRLFLRYKTRDRRIYELCV